MKQDTAVTGAATTQRRSNAPGAASSLMNALFRGMGGLVSPAGHRGRLAVFIYHRVLPVPDPMRPGEIDAAAFEEQMNLLSQAFNVLSLSEACERLVRRTLPARAVCITFDDGYADNEQVALPILKRFGFPATFFVATGFSSGGMMFNDRLIEAVRSATAGRHDLSSAGLGELKLGDTATRLQAVAGLITALMHRPLPERQAAVERVSEVLGSAVRGVRLMMTPEEIRRLHRSGMEIGAHTVSHPILKSMSEDDARLEIVQSKKTLEDITGSPVTLFAYPNGKPGRDYDLRHVNLVRDAGFAAAVSTTPGVAHRGSDLLQLPRFGPWDRNVRRLSLRLLASCARTLSA